MLDNSKKTNKNTKQKRRWSRLNHWLHLWLGLTSGSIVFIISLTGVLFIYCDNIIDGLAYNSIYVKEIKAERLTPEEILQSFKKQFPDRKASYYITYRDPKRSIKLASSTKDRDLQFSWIDPYTGKVLTSSKAYDFFYVIAHIHSGHIPFGDIGNLVVEISVWIFLIELITGIILWWPKKWNKSTRQQSFKIKTNASFKRLNYDLHNVPGFYNLLPALLITVTGLIIVNKTLNKTTHKIFDGMPRAYTEIRDIKPNYNCTKTFAPLNPIIKKLFASDIAVEQVKLSVPAKDSITAIYAVAANEIGLKGVQKGKTYSINRYNGQEMEISLKVLNGLDIDDTTMNLHIGFWAGWIGKTLTLAVGLICMFLPVTGFLIWYGRPNKTKKKRNLFKMKKVLLSLLLFFTIGFYAQDSITIGSRHHIFSKALNEERTFSIYLPPDYSNTKLTPAKYPVIYLLDAESNFHSFTGLHQSLAKGPYAMMPQMIVVGITNTNRTKDLTPTEANGQAFFDSKKKMFQQSGGNKNFIIFLEKELRPYIDSHYRTSGYNLLNGHSFGGLTAVNILLNHTELFNSYVIIDPSLWWDNEVMIKKADSIFDIKDFKQTSIYLAMANKINIPQDTTTDMARGIRKFEKLLMEKQPKNLRWDFKFYESEDHGTIPIPAAYDGLRFIFKEHLVQVKQAVLDPSIIEIQYGKLSKQTGFPFFPSESYLEWMVNYCISIQKKEQAEFLLKMFKKYYPAKL